MIRPLSTAVNSSMVHFEVIDKSVSVFLLIAEGRGTRPADERAVDFLKKYARDDVYLLDT